MKANRKFTRANDSAVSPVIAVILMVAITVVLAATVYVWASGFGSRGETTRAIALAGEGQLVDRIDGTANQTGLKNYTISSASTGFKWADVKVTLDGQILERIENCPAGPLGKSFFTICQGETNLVDSDIIRAGQSLQVYASQGQTLRLIDASANSVIYTTVVG